MTQIKHLFESFSPSSKEEWLEKVKTDLKGNTLETLNWDFEGMAFSPFYHREDSISHNQHVYSSKEQNSWYITETIDHRIPHEAHKSSLDALNGGCNALTFEIDNDIEFDFNKIFKDMQLEWIFLEFVMKNVDSLVFSEKLLNYAEGRGFDTDKLNGAIYSAKGVKDIDILDVRKGLLPNIKVIRIFANHTSSVIEELAAILTKTKNQLKRHHDKEAIAESLVFQLGMSDHYYSNIAKIRALKLLVVNVFKAFGIENCEPFVSIKINPNESESDENYDIIRCNTYAMAAAIGGADMINISSLDHSNGPDFSKRISRNISHLLQLESYIHRVKDPSSGSYFIENMTQEICLKAWDIFSKK